MNWAKFAIFFLLAVVAGAAAAERDKVVLQLKWEHEFQFAGYYAAQWQGYFAREGLDVEIRSAVMPNGQLLSPTQEVIQGRADFAVGGSDVVIERGHGNDLVVVAPIFQHSPTALYALKIVPLNDLRAVAKLRIAAALTDNTYTEMRAVFLANGIDPDRIRFVDAPVTIETLVNGIADVIVTYSNSAEARAEELGVALNVLQPRDFGVQFYGDMLFTSGALARENPQLVERFRRASLDGWRYALENGVEVANRIAAELPRYVYHYDDLSAYNIRFSRSINSFVYYPVVKLGHTDPARWQRNYQLLETLGEIERPFDPEKLLFSNQKVNLPLIYIVLALISMGILLVVIVIFGSRFRVWSALIAVVLVVSIIEQGLEYWHFSDNKTRQREEVKEKLATVRSQLEHVLAKNLSEINAVAAFIGSQPALDQAVFSAYAKLILERDRSLINLAAAPQMVVRFVYPLAGNETVIGLDYRTNKDQWPAVSQVVNSEKPLVAGPVDLVQGGQAFIGRAPVFYFEPAGNKRLWGIVSAPIETAGVYRGAGLLDPNLGLRVAIRGRDGSGGMGEPFFGHSEVFANPEVVTWPVVFDGGSWQLGAVASFDSALVHQPRLLLIRVSCVLIGTLLFLLIVIRYRHWHNQAQLETALRRHAQFAMEVESVAKVGGWRLDDDAHFSEFSAQARQLLGLTEDRTRITVAQFSTLFIEQPDLGLEQLFENALDHGEPFNVEVANSTSTGERRWLRLIGDPVADDKGNWELIGAIQDITDKKIADELIEFQANFDGITGLPNRALFLDRLEVAINKSKRTGNVVAVVFVDLDNFKSVNDNLGHNAGDLLLSDAARRIKQCVRESDTVGRHSGDEFTIILQDVTSDSAIYHVAKNIVERLADPFLIGNSQVFIGASVGVALYPHDAEDPDALLVKADQAMYEVKASGRNGWHFYTQEMQEKSEKRHRLFNDLVAAIGNNELSVHLQPIINIETGLIESCEALARWQRKDGSWESPAEFIQIAEESGLVNRIDYLMMEMSVQALREVNQRCGTRVGLSVNVSPRLFFSQDNALQRWMALVQSAVAYLPMSVEITERLLIEEIEVTGRVLLDLHNLGVGVSIDDFGTGFSSLSYLTRFPVSHLKIDRSFVGAIGNNSKEETLIESIIALAGKLKIKVIAEGVETSEQLAYLAEHRCDFAQGYFIDRPMPVAEFEKRLLESLVVRD